jgi:hypothetical protein
MLVTIDKASWDAGYHAGLRGCEAAAPRGYDGYSWCSGYIEGDAARQGFGRRQDAPAETEG